ncbi:MAG: hypothetical protein P8Z73_07715, partial [Desulfobacteraceae bacterium]
MIRNIYSEYLRGFSVDGIITGQNLEHCRRQTGPAAYLLLFAVRDHAYVRLPVRTLYSISYSVPAAYRSGLQMSGIGKGHLDHQVAVHPKPIAEPELAAQGSGFNVLTIVFLM